MGVKVITDVVWWTPAASVEELRRADHAMRKDGRAYVGVNVSWLATLAHNLAIGGALCAAYRCGCAQHTGPGPFWRPGIEIDRIAEEW